MQELKIFFTALMFYTRIPCPKWVDHDPTYINLSIRYFPLIGWIVGGMSALIYFGGFFLFSNPVAIVFSVIASVLVTGGFHEDGFADVCDAFGGGWTRDKILAIMKDSRLGTYGVLGLFLIVGLKILLLAELTTLTNYSLFTVITLFITAHAMSRFVASTFVLTHEYARDTNDSKAKPVAKQTSFKNINIGSIWAFIPLIFTCITLGSAWYLLIVIPTYLSKVYLARYFNKWIGGYTGDCLGATQQVAEIVIYSSMIVIWKFV